VVPAQNKKEQGTKITDSFQNTAGHIKKKSSAVSFLFGSLHPSAIKKPATFLMVLPVFAKTNRFMVAQVLPVLSP